MRLQFAGQRLRPVGDRARAETDDEITRFGHIGDHAGEVGRGFKRDGLAVPVRGQSADQCVAVDSLDRCLAGGVHIGHDHHVRVIQAGAKILEKRLEARIPMGLDDGKNKFTADILLVIWDTLKANNISIPFPQREVRMLGDAPKLAIRRKKPDEA